MGKVSVNAVKGNLYLLANLPKKSGEGSMPQRIPMRLPDTTANRKVAEKRRAVLQRQVDQGVFDWADWTDTAKGTTWRQAINALYRKRVVLGRTGESTWEVNYMGRLRQVDMNRVVTSQEVARFLQKWPRDTCSYKEAYYLAKDLCSLITVGFPEMPVPTYKKGALTSVPEDHAIIEWVQKGPPDVSWALGMLATYGLRPHELDRCRFIDDKHRLQVDDETKTGSRVVIPLMADWVEVFDLRNERRRVRKSLASDATAQWLHGWKKKLGMPFVPYALRHAYAGRLWRCGGSNLDVYTAARLMGHSISRHERTYREWIAPHTIAQRAEQALMANLQTLAEGFGSSAVQTPQV